MKPRDRLQSARLLLVTDPRPDLVARVEAAVRGGVDVVQLRDKHTPREELLPLAAELKRICDRAGALFTVNDDIELARLSGAAGVHLGQEDAPIASAREVLGPGAIVGQSANSVEEALEAVREGADYLGVGTVYYTPTKPDAEVKGPVLLREIARLNPPVPWFAIGGVTLETAREVAGAGAPGFAVVRAVLDAEDPEAAARELRSYFPSEGHLRG
ncbi:MAG TPA: thiamine phosphate synthase [Rubrobacteraceae bacterium]|nr:thiamine phosphate synthase [Rubrobacteraceae bacterium]